MALNRQFLLTNAELYLSVFFLINPIFFLQKQHNLLLNLNYCLSPKFLYYYYFLSSSLHSHFNLNVRTYNRWNYSIFRDFVLNSYHFTEFPWLRLIKKSKYFIIFKYLFLFYDNLFFLFLEFHQHLLIRFQKGVHSSQYHLVINNSVKMNLIWQ